MNRPRATRILREVTGLPTAPFLEQYVADYVRSFVKDRRGLTLKTDAAGNLLVRYKFGRKRIARPACFTAHMDHPGFEADRMIDKRRLRATWRGGVRPKFFRGSKVRFYADGDWTRGKITSIATTKHAGREVVKTAEIDLPRPVEKGTLGMWDLPDPATRNGRLYARVCDDLTGLAAMLACIDDLCRRRVSGEAYFLFTRAEEVGFVGAMAACRLKTVPKRCFLVAVENSSELSNARMGDGPILRVGDRATTFTSPATSFCEAVAKDLSSRSKRFQYQRRLMDGGTCESTAFCELGYEATGICLALGNYHNMNTRSGRIASEYINLNDYISLATWFVSIVTTKRRYAGHDADLRKRLRSIEKEHKKLLNSTAHRTKATLKTT